MDENQAKTTEIMDSKQSKAAEIRERFKQRPNSTQPERESVEDAKVESILDKAKEREKMYTEVGQERAVQHKKVKAKHEQEKTQYRQTTLRISLKDLARLKQLEFRFLSEKNAVLTYEKVLLAGLDVIEKMSDAELRQYVEKT